MEERAQREEQRGIIPSIPGVRSSYLDLSLGVVLDQVLQLSTEHRGRHVVRRGGGKTTTTLKKPTKKQNLKYCRKDVYAHIHAANTSKHRAKLKAASG